MFLNTQVDQLYKIESEVKKMITKNYDKEKPIRK
jgi:hypothetical protein